MNTYRVWIHYKSLSLGSEEVRAASEEKAIARMTARGYGVGDCELIKYG